MPIKFDGEIEYRFPEDHPLRRYGVRMPASFIDMAVEISPWQCVILSDTGFTKTGELSQRSSYKIYGAWRFAEPEKIYDEYISHQKLVNEAVKLVRKEVVRQLLVPLL